MFESVTSIMKTDVVRLMRPPIGLDLSDLSVKLIQLDRKGSGHQIRSFGKASIVADSIVNGEIEKPENVVEAIRSVLERAQPKTPNTNRVMCSIPETKAFLRMIDVPRMTDEEMHEAIRWELEENIPLKVDQVYFDYQRLGRNLHGENDKKESVLIVAVAKKIVDSLISILESVGLEVIGMEIESVAQARCLLPDKKIKERSTLVLDIGDKRTSLLLSVGDAIAFTSSTPLSSQMITDAYASRFNVSMEKAEKIKMEQGVGSVISNDPFYRASEPFLENLYSQVRHSMDFIVNTLGYADNVDEILLCGGGANTKGLPLYLSRKLSLVVNVGDPWTNVYLNGEVPPISREQAIQYSTAIGLALQALYFAYEDIP